MITHPDEIPGHHLEFLEPCDWQAHLRMGALPCLIDMSVVEGSIGDERSVQHNLWFAIAMMFIPVVGTVVLAIWCMALLRAAAVEVHRPIVRMAETSEGAELIHRGEELRRHLSLRSPDADEAEWASLRSSAEALHLEQQLLLARFRF